MGHFEQNVRGSKSNESGFSLNKCTKNEHLIHLVTISVV